MKLRDVKSVEFTPVGSRVTCNPPPTDTDEDFLVTVLYFYHDEAIAALSADGFALDNPNEHYVPDSGVFNSWRKGNTNIILTKDYDFARRFKAATFVAKQLNLLKKEDRVTLFQAVLYGNYPGNEPPTWEFPA